MITNILNSIIFPIELLLASYICCKLSARMSKLLTKNDKTLYFKIFIKKDTTFIIFLVFKYP